MRATLVASARNEGTAILEWVAWHRLIGFTDFLMFQNDSDDGTDEMLSVLHEIGVVEYRDNPARPGMHQRRAYRHAARSETFRRSDFVMVLDLDEFLAIHAGDGSLGAMIAAMPRFDHAMISWRHFSNAGRGRMSDALVTETFTDAVSRGSLARPGGVKSIFRTASFAHGGIHLPKKPRKPEESLVRVNSSGMVWPAFDWKGWRAADPGGAALAQVNHYAIKDVESFMVKSHRGAPTNTHKDVREGYWRKRNKGGVEDRLLADRADEIRAEMRALDAMSQGRLMALRAEAFRRHRRRAEESLRSEVFRGLREFCLQTPPAPV